MPDVKQIFRRLPICDAELENEAQVNGGFLVDKVLERGRKFLILCRTTARQIVVTGFKEWQLYIKKVDSNAYT